MICATLAAAALLASVVRADALDPAFYSTPWEDVCASGKAQTPIDLESKAPVPMPKELLTEFTFPLVKNVKLKNTGYALKVEWDPITDKSTLPSIPVAGDSISAVLEDSSLKPDRMVKVEPVQFHFHQVSEHLIGGFYSAAELHIVTFVAKGEAPEWGCDAFWNGEDPVLDKCTAVFGVMYRIGKSSPPWFDRFFTEAPTVLDTEKGKQASGGQFDLMNIIPEDKTYWSYTGSLTTPPCAEHLRWHVFKEEPTITIETLQLMTDWYSNTTDAKGNKHFSRTNYRLPQPIGERTIYKHIDPNAPAGGTETPAQNVPNADGGAAQPGQPAAESEAAAPDAAVASPFAALAAIVTFVAALWM